MLVSLACNQLRPQRAIGWHLYHPSGRMLLPAGRELTASYLAAMKRAGVGPLFACQDEDDVCEVRRRAPKVPVSLEATPDGQSLPYDLFNKQGALLLPAGRRLSAEELARVSNGDTKTAYRLCPEGQAETRLLMDELVVDVVRRLDRDVDERGGMRLTPAGEPVSKLLDNGRTSRTPGERDRMNALMAEACERTDDVLDHLGQGHTLHGQEIAETSLSLLHGLISDKSLLTGLVVHYPHADAFLVKHSVNVALLAFAIGTQMGLGKKQLAVLGSAALLHDVGMLAVPSEVLYKPGRLSPSERYEITKHPMRGLNILEQVTGHDQATQYVVYQEHERESGAGYPRGRTGHWIADMARIIAVADVFEAIASPRPYREANLPYESMATVVRMAGDRLLHPSTVRALVTAVGLFPLGSLVKMSDGSVGRVVAITPARYDRPTVCRLRDAQGRVVRDGVVDLSAFNLSVVEPASPASADIQPMEGF